MTNPDDTPLHVFNQTPAALLPPAAAELAVIEARLDRFARRLRLNDADRKRIESARAAVAAARVHVEELTAAARLAERAKPIEG